MDYERFVSFACNNLRMLRIMNDFTQADVAEMLGISRSSYSAMETGKQVMSFYTACFISEIYSIDVGLLVSEDMFARPRVISSPSDPR